MLVESNLGLVNQCPSILVDIHHVIPQVLRLALVHPLLCLGQLSLVVGQHHGVDVSLEVVPQGRSKYLVTERMQLHAFFAWELLVLEVEAQLVSLHGGDALEVTFQSHLVLKQSVVAVESEQCLQRLEQSWLHLLLSFLVVIH